MWTCVYLSLTVATLAYADLYAHNPRGSNNRLRETTATRNNANRLFDSQNNNRGGYNVGDTGADKATSESQQYRMKYFQSSPGQTTDASGRSLLTIQWTNQHGCGADGPEKQNCILVIQYMCQKQTDKLTDSTLRNGFAQNTPQYTKPATDGETYAKMGARKKGDIKTDRGQHEMWDWYDQCYKRERNRGLFLADQKLKKNKQGYSSAIYTRQNPGGTQRGYECPEERDYYPYWHPTPWVDIAVLADKTDKCSDYRRDSFNTHRYGSCIVTKENKQRRDTRWNNPQDCADNAGSWVTFANYLERAPGYTNKAECESSRLGGQRLMWAVPYDAVDVYKAECLVALEAPDCIGASKSRSNHLGDGADATPHNYTWVLPHFPSGDIKSCVLRMRYNISTDDYDPSATDYRQNGGKDVSPVVGNPYVNIGRTRNTLRLNVNTNQYGRTFQDRSHVFHFIPRPSGTSDVTIYNLNARGKRGNIVQVYPAVEYDFYPKVLQMKDGDMVHVQWTGSNSHNNGGNGGDGQAGNDGQGKAGTDRHNIVEIMDLSYNYPVPFESTTLWDNAEVKWIHHGDTSVSSVDLAVNMASSGYYRCMKKKDCGKDSAETKTKIQKTLDNSPASYGGALLRFRKGMYHYMCTRNNNFTNRSQKGTIIVK